MDQLLGLDHQITQTVNAIIPRTKFLDAVFSFFSMNGSSLFVWIIVMIAVALMEEIAHPGIQKRDVKFLMYFTVSFAVTFVISNYIFKNIMYRPRPYLTLNIIQTSCPVDSSFPSTHAATAFASAVILSCFDKKRKWLYYAIALIIGVSRIYLHCHYVIDVISGSMMGYCISKTLLVFRFSRRSH